MYLPGHFTEERIEVLAELVRRHPFATLVSLDGDGLIAALQVLAVLRTEDKPLSELAHAFDPVPQILQNVKFARGAKPLDSDAVKDAIARAEATLTGSQGRLLVRASGTEPVIRVMAEGDDADKVRAIVAGICDTIDKAARAAS